MRLRAALLRCGFGETLSIEPVIELIDPVIAGRALLRHAETVAAGAIDMHFGSCSGRGQRREEPRTGASRQRVVLRPGEKYRRKVVRYGRNSSEWTSVDGSRECRPG